jgi:two-component sensor histidine kinase
LNLQANVNNDPMTSWLLRESQNRIRTIALIHSPDVRSGKHSYSKII